MNFDDILDKADKITNAELDGQISSLIRLTDAELKELFPTRVDKESLIKLMRIVRSSASENFKKSQIINDINVLAGAIVRLVSKAV